MIEILLATYNGEKFLKAQLDSILKQTYQSWCILAHDDGSIDATLDILHDFKREYPSKIKILDDEISFGSARDNFEHLLKHATADYVMLCDQDDVWLDDKIVQTLSMMKKMEYQNPNKPVLVHTDLIVANEKLDVIAPSLFAYQRLRKNSRLSNLMVRNNVTGCTVMLNQKALMCALPIPREAMMHDWWLVLKVKQLGMVGFVDRPTMYYRQHGENCLGAVKVDLKYFLMRSFFGVRTEGRPSFVDVLKQAQVLDSNVTLKRLYLQKYIMVLRVLLYLERFQKRQDLGINEQSCCSKKKVILLLSSYQGRTYLEKQIQSIQEQSFQNWELLIRDDGSSDATYELLESLQAKDERIHLMPPANNVGAIQSFSTLMKEGLQRFSEASYFMFADQDDIWLPLKIEKTLVCMQRLEEEYSHVLIHSDLEVVDNNLQTIAPSFFKFQHIQHKNDSALQVLLVQNFVTGCTVMVNRKLLQTASPVPGAAMMHDWWLALCAASIGKVGFVSQATMLYRQHQGNSVGAKGFWFLCRDILASPSLLLRRRERFAQVCKQARSLEVFLQSKGIEQSVVRSFVGLSRLPWYQRVGCVRASHIKPQFWVRKLVFWWDVLRVSKKDEA
jgi:glycosyltransferase involved in cell wall biosynthesis